MNLRGTTAIPTPPVTAREHRDRLRQLEANPSGLKGTAWTPFPLYLNGWTGFRTNGEEYQDPDAAYMRDSDNFVHLRGRLFTPTLAQIGGNWQNGAVACVLDSGYRPQYDQFFLCDGSNIQAFTFDFGSGGSAILIRPDGSVIPFVNQAGLGMGDPNGVVETFGAGHVPLNTAYWWNTPTNDFGYVTGGGFGNISGGAIADEVAVLYGTPQFGPTDVSVTWQGGSSFILGLNVIPQVAQLRAQPIPDGWYCQFHGVTAGSDICMFEVRKGIRTTISCASLTIPTTLLPINLIPGMIITFRRTHSELLYFIGGGRGNFGTKAGEHIEVVSTVGSDCARGYAAIGGNGPTPDVAFFSDVRVGMSGAVSACLDGISFEAFQ